MVAVLDTPQSMPLLPRLISAQAQASQFEDSATETRLRHRHWGRSSGPAPDSALLPALLWDFRNPNRLRYGYPLFLHDPRQPEKIVAEPVYDLLERHLAELYPSDEQQRLVKDNLPRLEQLLQHRLAESAIPQTAKEVLQRTSQTLQDQLQLKGDSGQRLGIQLEQLLAALPAQGHLLNYGPHTALHLCLQAIRHHLYPHQKRFFADIKALAEKLRNFLRVEWDKSAAARQPEAIARSIGNAATQFIDPDAYATVLGQVKGSQRVVTERLARIQNCLAILENFQSDASPPIATVIYENQQIDEWLADISDCSMVRVADPCTQAITLFDQHTESWAKLFRAMRIACLELADHYDPQTHDDWFASFSWETFSQTELQRVPPIVVLETDTRLASDYVASFSRLLRSAKPVQMVVEAHPARSDSTNTDATDSLAYYHLELGYLAVSHRHALVQQSSPARPHHYLAGLEAALKNPQCGVHLLVSGHEQTTLLPWLAAGAAIDSRAHPLFQINPSIGQAWADRLTLAENSQPQADWPVSALSYQTDQDNQAILETPFTFADFGLLDPRLQNHYCQVPNHFESDALTPLAEYLITPSETTPDRRLPFVWAVDQAGILQRVVVSRALVLACQDRQDFWRTLQELAGIHNRHVALAVAQTQAKLEAQAFAEKEQLTNDHAKALELARREAAYDAIHRLTETILNLDLTDNRALPDVDTAAPSMPPPEPETLQLLADAYLEETREADTDNAAQQREAAVPVSTVSQTLEEAWIDSPLCTSCNDCISRNPRLFIYNDDKQAILGDPQAGSYADLVEAAEACPARCIHPGSPRNPDEPNLDALVARAAPLNSFS